jgi:hypothetical protein
VLIWLISIDGVIGLVDYELLEVIGSVWSQSLEWRSLDFWVVAVSVAQSRVSVEER